MSDHASQTRTFLTPPEDLVGAEGDAMLDELAREVSDQLCAPTAQSPAFFAAALGALKRIKSDVSAQKQIGCLLDITRFFYVSGQPLHGLEPAAEAVGRAERLGDKRLMRLAYMLHALLLADTGHLCGAIEGYATALRLATELDDRPAQCSVWNNLGLAFLYAGQHHDAIACFERVLELAAGTPLLRSAGPSAYGNIALAYLQLEEFRKGLRAVRQAVVESGEPSNSADMLARVIIERNYARLLLEVDNLAKARERSDIAKHYAALSKSPRAEVNAAIAEGLCEVHAGLVDVGLSRLMKTLEKARALKSALRDALMAIVRAYEVVGEPEQALVYLRELMQHMRKTQQENALFHHRLHLQQLEQLEGKATDPEAEGDPSPMTVLERREAVLKGQLAERELMRSRVELLERLAVTAELRDDATGEHSYRVGRLAALLAAEVGCDDDTCFMMELAARLHDIGKIGIPDGILLKTDRLTQAERQIMQTHATVGAELLAQSNIAHMQMAEEIARHHHEWWDGSGYPAGLSGVTIPLAARITALADVFDALTHKRPYKEAWPVARALEELAYLDGKQFDPSLTQAFIGLVRRLQREQGDLDVYLGQAAQSSPFIQARRKISDALRRPDEDRLDLGR